MGINFRYATDHEELDAQWGYDNFEKLAQKIGKMVNPSDPIHRFLQLMKNISYYEDIPSHVCETISPRIRIIAKKIKDPYDKKCLLEIADAMDYCAEHEVDFEYC